jgi:hypothetical protein
MKVLQRGEKFKRLINHPMHPQINSYGRGRLKRSSFMANFKELAHADPILALAQPRHIQPACMTMEERYWLVVRASNSPPWSYRLPELDDLNAAAKMALQHMNQIHGKVVLFVCYLSSEI